VILNVKISSEGSTNRQGRTSVSHGIGLSCSDCSLSDPRTVKSFGMDDLNGTLPGAASRGGLSEEEAGLFMDGLTQTCAALRRRIAELEDDNHHLRRVNARASLSSSSAAPTHLSQHTSAEGRAFDSQGSADIVGERTNDNRSSTREVPVGPILPSPAVPPQRKFVPRALAVADMTLKPCQGRQRQGVGQARTSSNDRMSLYVQSAATCGGGTDGSRNGPGWVTLREKGVGKGRPEVTRSGTASSSVQKPFIKEINNADEAKAEKGSGWLVPTGEEEGRSARGELAGVILSGKEVADDEDEVKDAGMERGRESSTTAAEVIEETWKTCERPGSR
ncbi:unnamed protein product, partial [Discosporangium mesarthrocarpum]